MRLIDNPCTDPPFNHALEEYYFTESPEECFILWQNAPCILIGKNQDATAEIDENYCAAHRLPVIRRITGGGAVYNDLGNINFGFISHDASDVFADFRRFTEPVIAALRALGVTAELSGRNDLLIGGRKFSGNAQHRSGGRTLHHGTLLFSSDLAAMSAALRVNPAKSEGRGVRSVFSRVTNIRDHLPCPMEVFEFRSFLMDFVGARLENATPYSPGAADLDAIRRLREEKYATDRWNYGERPAPGGRRFSRRFPSGTVDIRLDTKDGRISGISIRGDFFSIDDIARLENRLTGVPPERGALLAALAGVDVGQYIAGVTSEQLAQLIGGPETAGGVS